MEAIVKVKMHSGIRSCLFPFTSSYSEHAFMARKIAYMIFEPGNWFKVAVYPRHWDKAISKHDRFCELEFYFNVQKIS